MDFNSLYLFKSYIYKAQNQGFIPIPLGIWEKNKQTNKEKEKKERFVQWDYALLQARQRQTWQRKRFLGSEHSVRAQSTRCRLLGSDHRALFLPALSSELKAPPLVTDVTFAKVPGIGSDVWPQFDSLLIFIFSKYPIAKKKLSHSQKIYIWRPEGQDWHYCCWGSTWKKAAL